MQMTSHTVRDIVGEGLINQLLLTETKAHQEKHMKRKHIYIFIFKTYTSN